MMIHLFYLNCNTELCYFCLHSYHTDIFPPSIQMNSLLRIQSSRYLVAIHATSISKLKSISLAPPHCLTPRLRRWFLFNCRYCCLFFAHPRHILEHLCKHLLLLSFIRKIALLRQSCELVTISTILYESFHTSPGN